MTSNTGKPLLQQGMIAIMLAAGLAVLLGIVGLAIDFGHAYVNKTRLQNLADALALSAGRILNDTRSTTQATDAITTLFNLNLSFAGNKELQQRLSITDVSIAYSDHLSPFISGGSSPRYIKVTINNLNLQSWFIRVLGIGSVPLSAQAIAGPSKPLSSLVCNSSPVMLCGNSAQNPANNGGSNFWGYVPGAVQILKAGSNTGGVCLGPGNYQLVSIGDLNSGADEVRELLAGNQEGCADFGSGIETKPGDTAGPSIQGLNTRFGEYIGAMNGKIAEYPPDVVTTEANVKEQDLDLDEGYCAGGQVIDLDFNWQAYKQKVSQAMFDFAPPVGVVERRILKVPIGDCDNMGEINGRTVVPYLGVGCFFVLKSISNADANIYGEFVRECMQDGVVDPDSTIDDGPYKVILHGGLS